jgi:DNA-(apurinic or apyrimidinic site) lyase
MTHKTWHDLGAVMNQALHEKTICFAMKCLGVSLMMAGEHDFYFADIPIPVDSRVCKFTERLGLKFGENTRKIQEFWQGVLSILRQPLPNINMIHLDSLIWQIAHQDNDGLRDYFAEMGIGDTARRLAYLLQAFQPVKMGTSH